MSRRDFPKTLESKQKKAVCKLHYYNILNIFLIYSILIFLKFLKGLFFFKTYFGKEGRGGRKRLRWPGPQSFS